jgi:hypothetical protein
MSEKTLTVKDMEDLAAKVPDVEVVGKPGEWKLICKASSQGEGWMRSTKAMSVSGGALVQVSTHQRNYDGTNAVAEALEFLPGVKLMRQADGSHRIM